MSSVAVSVGDRLGSTLFLAALVHGVVILGVTFGSAPFGSDDTLPSLNVTLIVETRNAEPAPDDGDFLAQRSQRGSGSAAPGERPTTTLPAEDASTRSGDSRGADAADAQPAEPAPALEQLATHEPNDTRLRALPQATEQAAAEPRTPAAMLNNPAAPALAAEIDTRVELPEEHDRELVVSPSTRESDLAAYLDSWRRRVERVGTANFPLIGDRNTRPALEVAIGKDGNLRDVVVLRSSGDTVLDQAALRILRLAMPFDPLPESIGRRYDVLRFAYEWDFSGVAGADTGLSGAD
jgi:periplasmic protein TonB